MPRGGFRPGAGRKKRDPSAKAAATRITADTPLEYLKAVMADETADPLRRDRAAQVLMPFLHPRAPGMPSSYNYTTKKDEATKRAKWAGFGTTWWELLHTDQEREEREAELARDPELRKWVEAEMHRSAEAEDARKPVPAPESKPEVKSPAGPNTAEADRWAEYLGHGEPETDWTNPETGRSDLEFNPRNYRYPPPRDNED